LDEEINAFLTIFILKGSGQCWWAEGLPTTTLLFGFFSYFSVKTGNALV